MRSYEQRCPLARALDVVGERWTLLVIRELLLGPRRYTDLLAGLPGIGTNVLADRLRELLRNGVVGKRRLPPPAAVSVYELTAAGRELAESVGALSRWGEAHGSPPTAEQAARPAWVLLSVARRRETGIAPGTTCELAVGEDVFMLSNVDGAIEVSSGNAVSPAATLSLGRDTFFGLARGAIGVRQARSESELGGDVKLGAGVLAALAGAIATPS